MKFLRIFTITTLLLFSSVQSQKLKNGIYAKIKTNKGEITLKLHYKDVPLTVANFIALAEGTHPKVKESYRGKPYYDGIKFHRVISDFMIQTGDPTGTGRGDAGYKFVDEFPTNDNNKLKYKHDKAGTLSMANSGPGTNSSQFFITHKDTPWLNKRHTVFGFVIKGLDIVNKIKKNDVMEKVEIIKVGKDAKGYNAKKTFTEATKKIEREAKEKLAKLKVLKQKFKKSKGIEKATKTNTGLLYLQLKKGNGTKVKTNVPCTVHYTLYSDTGVKIDSSIDRQVPFVFTINNAKMIPGWIEGLKMMEVGEKARLFIPSFLGYGKVGRLPHIAPDTDLIFEVEIIKNEQ